MPQYDGGSHAGAKDTPFSTTMDSAPVCSGESGSWRATISPVLSSTAMVLLPRVGCCWYTDTASPPSVYVCR